MLSFLLYFVFDWRVENWRVDSEGSSCVRHFQQWILCWVCWLKRWAWSGWARGLCRVSVVRKPSAVCEASVGLFVVCARPLRAPSVGARALMEGIRVIAVLQSRQQGQGVYSCRLPLSLEISPTQVSRQSHRGCPPN
jgi:hypothetical protein